MISGEANNYSIYALWSLDVTFRAIMLLSSCLVPHSDVRPNKWTVGN